MPDVPHVEEVEGAVAQRDGLAHHALPVRRHGEFLEADDFLHAPSSSPSLRLVREGEGASSSAGYSQTFGIFRSHLSRNSCNCAASWWVSRIS